MPAAQAALAAALAALALGSCGNGDTTVDAGRAERFVRGVVAEQVGARVAAVRCPEGLPAEPDATFACSVVGTDDSKGVVDVRQRDDEGNIRVDAPFLHVRQAEAVMVAQMSRPAKADVEVDCQEIVMVRRGERFTCKVSSEGVRRTVAARLTDDEGRFRYRPWRASSGDAREPR